MWTAARVSLVHEAAWSEIRPTNILEEFLQILVKSHPTI
jgi:hypothetical protein